jgi:hypothetical protein
MLIKWENFGAFLSRLFVQENILTGDVLKVSFAVVHLCTRFST